jgi:beta-glucosidase
MIDVSRDPRWGRVVEGFGEDPYLTARFGAAKALAYQSESVLACLKHYVGYGMAEGGRDYNTADASEQRLRNVYLEPFRHAVAAGAATVMASFNTMSGVPMHANRYLLTEVLKNEWRHAGIVVGDAEGVQPVGPARRGPGRRRRRTPGAERRSGRGDGRLGAGRRRRAGRRTDDVDESRIDDAVLRLLRLKMSLGLFDNPYVDERREITAPTNETRAAARWAAERSVVLLKNDDRVLPIVDDERRILLAGPYATSTDHLGAWVQHFAAGAGTLATPSPGRCRGRGSRWWPARSFSPRVPACRRRPGPLRPTPIWSSSRWASPAISPARPDHAATSACPAIRNDWCTPSPTPACRSWWCSATGVRSM